MNKSSHSIYLIIALVAMSFVAGRFSANSSLLEENRKLQESVRLLRGDRSGLASTASGGRVWRDEQRPSTLAVTPPAETPVPTPTTTPVPPLAAVVPVPATASVAAAAVSTPTTTSVQAPAVIEKPRPETGVPALPTQQRALPASPKPQPAPVRATPEAVATAPAVPDRKTSRKWVSNFGDHIQGTATYWRCNNATLVASGMEYYAYGSIPASRLQKPGDAYSVRDGTAIVISGCWSPKLGKAILYRKSDGQRWDRPIDLDNGAWSLVVE